MGKYKLVVLSDAVEGREEEFNDWYSNQHLGDIVDIPGFASAQRLKLKSVQIGHFKNKYLAIYEMDTDDPDKAIEIMLRRRDTGEMFITDAFDWDNASCGVFEVCSETVFAPNTKPRK